MLSKRLGVIRHAQLNTGVDEMNLELSIRYEDGAEQSVITVLDEHDDLTDSRVGTVFGIEFIRRLLIEFNVNCIHELTGRVLWVMGTTGDPFSEYTVIGYAALSIENGSHRGIVLSELKRDFS